MLWNISLSVDQGETVMLGANGASKTTTLRTICGAPVRISGNVRFKDEDIPVLEPQEVVSGGIAHAPEDREILTDSTVKETSISALTATTTAAENAANASMRSFPNSKSARTSAQAPSRAANNRCSPSAVVS